MRLRINGFWGAIAALFAALAGVLCFFGAGNRVLLAKPGGDPQQTVTEFFEMLEAGSFSTLGECMSGYSAVGLDKEPASEEGRLMLSALRSSYRGNIQGNCIRDGLEAAQPVVMHFLNVAEADRAATALAMESGDYLTALKQVLADPDSCSEDRQIELHLTYSDGKWLVKADEELLGALQGGID